MNISAWTLGTDMFLPMLQSLSNVLDKGVRRRKQAGSSGA
jgi:hypothetical protein